MRKMAIALLAIGLTAVLVAPAMAASLLAETFTYNDGSLRATSGGLWVQHSGSTNPVFDFQVLSGVANGNNNNAPDDNRSLSSTPGPTDKTYYCLNLRVPTQTVPTGLTYITHLKDTGTFDFVGRLYLIPQGNAYTVGLSYGSCNADDIPSCNPTVWPGVLHFDQWYTIVVSYDASSQANGSELWVDPSSELDAKITHNFVGATTSGGGAIPAQSGFSVSAFALRQSSFPPSGSPGSSTWLWQVDNIGVGTTFSDACSSAPVPVNRSTWGRMKTLYR